jgi:hypothetical protein
MCLSLSHSGSIHAAAPAEPDRVGKRGGRSMSTTPTRTTTPFVTLARSLPFHSPRGASFEVEKHTTTCLVRVDRGENIYNKKTGIAWLQLNIQGVSKVLEPLVFAI